MIVRLMRYDVKLVYTPGKSMFIADTLSRAYLTESTQTNSEFDFVVHTVSKYLSVTPERRTQFQQETARDECLQLVKQFIQVGWPEAKEKVDEKCRHYFDLRCELSEHDGLLFLEDKVIVPDNMRRELINKVHESHLGSEKTIKLARSIMYWPGMSREIKDRISKCEICLKHQVSNHKEPLLPHPVPDFAWQKIGIDILEFKGKSYLAAKDYYSKWVDCLLLSKGKSAGDVIECLKMIFTFHGVPETIVCDNVPFNSQMFYEFSRKYGFQVTFSSPTYSQSNGMAESGVKVAKNILKKCSEENVDLCIGLINYNNTPVGSLKYSPAQILQSRMLRSTLPTSSGLLGSRLAANVKQDLLKM
jgi:hypothetical protein